MMDGGIIRCSFSIGIFIIFLSSALSGQLPKSSVYIADLRGIPSNPVITGVNHISSFNPAGYNNQPRLFDVNTVYMTVGMDTNTVTDIYSIDVTTGKFKVVTGTEDISEFSATPSPEGNHFSTVRIENDQNTQSLWLYPMDMSNNGIRLLPNLSNVGYHCWVGKDTVALFLVDSINTLAIANIKTGEITVVAENIGRCLRSQKANNITFVQKSDTYGYALSQYNTLKKVTRTIAKMPNKVEDFDILKDGSIISGDEGKMVLLDLSTNNWKEIANFSSLGISNINRIHALGDKIVFVNAKP